MPQTRDGRVPPVTAGEFFSAIGSGQCAVQFEDLLIKVNDLRTPEYRFDAGDDCQKSIMEGMRILLESDVAESQNAPFTGVILHWRAVSRFLDFWKAVNQHRSRAVESKKIAGL